MSEDAKRDAAILRLGRKLVAELDLKNGTDTLSRWMAHDIAELMYEAEQASGVDAMTNRAACRDAIIALWKYRAGASERLARMGTLKGWIRFLRSRDNPFLSFEADRFSAPEDKSEAELYLALASMLRDSTAPMVRAALHMAAQSADPALEEEASIAARARLETEETKVTRVLISWSKGEVSRTAEMRAEVEASIDRLNAAAKALLHGLDQLSSNEVTSEDDGTVQE